MGLQYCSMGQDPNGRLVPEGDAGEMPVSVGDMVEYAGNWGFGGEVVNIQKRTVVVQSETGEVKKFDYMDLTHSE